APLSRDEERFVLGLAGRSLTHPEMPRAVANDIPDWLEPYLAKLYGNRLDADPTRWSRLGLRVAHRVPLAGTAAFKDGLVEVQDEGSQIAALLADARPGMRVVDFCAGAGGKTLALAAGMANRGKLVACDVSARRLERAVRRLRRAGISNVERRVLA